MKTIVCCLFIFGISITAYAQKPVVANWGITLGVSSTQVQFKDKGSSQSTASGLSFDRSTDLTGGLFAELIFPKVKWLSIRNDLTHRKYDASSGDFYQGLGQTH